MIIYVIVFAAGLFDRLIPGDSFVHILYGLVIGFTGSYISMLIIDYMDS